MKRTLKLSFLAAIAVLLVLVAGCGGDDESTGGSGSSGDKPDGDAVKIGFLAGLTGDYGPWGEAGLAAAQVAVDEVNAEGGILGRPVEIVPFDHGSKVERVPSGWKKLVEVDGVVGVGGMESDGAIAMLDESADAEVPIMCPACGTPVLDTKGGQYVWRLTGGDTDLGVVLAQMALGKTDNVASLTQQGLSATEDITKIFNGAFEKGGGTVAADVRFNAEAPTFRSEVEEAFGASEWVLVSTGLDAGTQILTEWTRQGSPGNLILIPELVVPEVTDTVGDQLDGKAWGVNPTYETSSPAYSSFAERYKEATGNDPSAALYEPAYYDQILLFAIAATQADEVSGKAIRDQLAAVSKGGKVVNSYKEALAAIKAGEDVDFNGASGAIDFDDVGRVSSIYAEQHLDGGKWAEGEIIDLDTALRP